MVKEGKSRITISLNSELISYLKKEQGNFDTMSEFIEFILKEYIYIYFPVTPGQFDK